MKGRKEKGREGEKRCSERRRGSLMKGGTEGRLLWPGSEEMEFHLLLDVLSMAGLRQKKYIYLLPVNSKILLMPSLCLIKPKDT